MKGNWAIILLAAMLAMTGCEFGGTDPEKPVQNETEETQTNLPETESAVAEVDYAAIYQPVIDGFFKLASGDVEENESRIPEGGSAILEGNDGGSSNRMLWESGFMLLDLSGDSIPELVIGSVTEEEYEGYGTAIYAVYTIADNQPRFVLDGFYRNIYYLLEDGSIFNQGSAGAAYSIFGIYALSENGQELFCRDYWFTHEKEGNYEDIRCWHNTVGEMDTAISEELDMTLDAFWEMEGELMEQITALELTSFGAYGGLEKPVYESDPTVSAVYAHEYMGECDEYTIDDSEYAAKVVFTTDGAVRDFKLITLTLNEITDDGDVSFKQ